MHSLLHLQLMAGRVQNQFINSPLGPCLFVWPRTVSQLGKGDLRRFRMKKTASSLRTLQMPPHIESYGELRTGCLG